MSRLLGIVAGIVSLILGATTLVYGHGSAVSPISRSRLVFESNPADPSFQLARDAVAIDGASSYADNWAGLLRDIPEAVEAGLPEGFDYSPWVPDGQIASGGRTRANAPGLPYFFEGLDQASDAWPTTPVTAGEVLDIDFLAPNPHDPSVWDVWMTTPDWDPGTALNWAQMEFLERPAATLTNSTYEFDVTIPDDRVGHHVLWIAWQRDEPGGQVYFSTSDLLIENAADFSGDRRIDGADYTQWLNTFGDAVTPGAGADGNGDGVIDAADYTVWRDALPQVDRAAAVPEPAAWALLALVVSGLVLSRRRAGR